MRTRAAPRAVLGHQHQSVQIHTPTGQLAIGFRSHEAARVIPGRARAGSPDGRAPGRCRRMCGARCVGSRVALLRRQRGLVGPGVNKSGDRTPFESSAGLMVVLVAAKVTGSPQSWPGRTSATHLRAAPLNFPAAYRTRAQEAYPVYVVRRESLVHSKDRFEWSLRPVEWSP